jgi:hypothetical protein
MKLLLISSVIVFMAACSTRRELATVAEACQKDDGAMLMVEGSLRPPNLMEAYVNPETEVTTYQLVLVDDSDEKRPSINTAVFGTRSSHANRIAELSPEGFTQRDLQIFTDNGEIAGSLDRLKITGKLSKAKDGRGLPCILEIERIENIMANTERDLH